MTLCIGFATAHFALLASDTRTFRPAIDDLEESRPLGPVESDDERKLCRLTSGWFASGPELGWAREAYRAVAAVDVRDWPTFSRVLSDEARARIAELDDKEPERAAFVRRRTMTLLVRPSVEDGFRVDVRDWAGDCLMRGLGPWGTRGFFPREIPREEQNSLLEGAQAALDDHRRFHGQRFGVYVAVAVAAAFFAEVYRRCGPTGSIGPRIEIGTLSQGETGELRQERLGPVEASTLTHSAVVEELLTEDLCSAS